MSNICLEDLKEFCEFHKYRGKRYFAFWQLMIGLENRVDKKR